MRGLCDACNALRAVHTCQLCGKKVCVRCFDPRAGVCVYCVRGRFIS